MCDHPCRSRRTILKTLGGAVAGAALAGALPRELEAQGKPGDPVQAKTPANPVDLALARFGKPHNCCGAVFSPFAEHLGIDDGTALKLTAGFGGGMYSGSVCGAVTGGIMAISLKYGGPGNPPFKAATLTREFTDRFKAKHPSTLCADITGIAWNKPEMMKLVRGELNKPEDAPTVKALLGGRDYKEIQVGCQAAVRDAATIVAELLGDGGK